LNPIVGDIICNEKGDYDFITAETLSRYSLDDVYLPLPGFDNKYPKYALVHAIDLSASLRESL